MLPALATSVTISAAAAAACERSSTGCPAQPRVPAGVFLLCCPRRGPHCARTPQHTRAPPRRAAPSPAQTAGGAACSAEGAVSVLPGFGKKPSSRKKLPAAAAVAGEGSARRIGSVPRQRWRHSLAALQQPLQPPLAVLLFEPQAHAAQGVQPVGRRSLRRRHHGRRQPERQRRRRRRWRLRGGAAGLWPIMLLLLLFWRRAAGCWPPAEQLGGASEFGLAAGGRAHQPGCQHRGYSAVLTANSWADG